MAEQDMVLALIGNCYLQQRVSVYRDEPFLKMVKLFRDADVTISNLECCLQDGEDFPALVAGNGRGATYMQAPPYIPDELKWMGIDMVCAANNHSADFAEGGILTNMKYLKAADLPFAGIGASLTDATKPAYFETAKGRVALISVSDWGPRGRMDLPFQTPAAVMAADQGPHFKSRPGVNLLRYEPVTQVDRATFDALRRASQELGWEQSKSSRSKGGGRAESHVLPSVLGNEQDTETLFHFMGRKFALADKFDFTTEPYKEDLERNYHWIREARRQADWVVVALHDQGARRPAAEEYTKIFAHGAIDAGADIYLNNGARHGGVEIYKDKVILYGVPNWFLQNEQVQRVPAEMLARWGLGPESTAGEFLEARDQGEARGGSVVSRSAEDTRRHQGGSAVHSLVYDKDRKLKEIRIHPLALSPRRSGPRSQRGVPSLAEPGSEKAKDVLEMAIEQSKPFGTKVTIDDGVGIIRV